MEHGFTKTAVLQKLTSVWLPRQTADIMKHGVFTFVTSVVSVFTLPSP